MIAPRALLIEFPGSRNRVTYESYSSVICVLVKATRFFVRTGPQQADLATPGVGPVREPGCRAGSGLLRTRQVMSELRATTQFWFRSQS